MIPVKINPCAAILLLLSFILNHSVLSAQANAYTVNKAHSHNDYRQLRPFYMAYEAGFGSMEADLYLIGNELLVAHDPLDLFRKRNFESTYLKPLMDCIQNNRGYPFSDSTKRLQILVDVKSEALSTLGALVQLIQKYPLLVSCKGVSWVISGNRPEDSLFSRYPDFILFDGDLSRDYSDKALSRIVLMSDDFRRYSFWGGKSRFPGIDYASLQHAVWKSHHLNKPVRFWNTPDVQISWALLEQLQVDYINTDHIAELVMFLKGQTVSSIRNDNQNEISREIRTAVSASGQADK